MKDYLNKNETLGYITLGAGLAFAQTLEETAVGKERTYIKYIQTYIKKYQSEVYNRLSDANNQKIGKMVEMNTIKIVPVTNPESKRVTLDIEPLEDIAELILDSYCLKCSGNMPECEVRQALISCFVPECNPDKDKCCYYMGE